MKALGMIETMGMIGAVEALDVACKTANVEILNTHKLQGGIIAIEIAGDVSAVKAAVDAGSEAVKRLGVFISSHVIARPDNIVYASLEKEIDTKEETKVVVSEDKNIKDNNKKNKTK